VDKAASTLCDVARDGPCDVARDGPCDVARDGPCDVARDGPCDVARDGPCEAACAVVIAPAVTSRRVREPAPRAEIQGVRRATRDRVCSRNAGGVLVPAARSPSVASLHRAGAWDFPECFARARSGGVDAGAALTGRAAAVVDVPDNVSRRARRSAVADVALVRELALLRVIGPSTLASSARKDR